MGFLGDLWDGVKDNIGAIGGGTLGFVASGFNPAGALIGASLGSGADASGAAKDAADAQVDAAQDANQVAWNMYQQSRQDQLPWMQAGTDALGQLPGMIEQGPGDFQASPGYEFVKGEGERAINRGLASRGLYGSGKALKDLTRFNQGLASTEYQNFVNNWISTKLNPTQSLAGVGQSTAANMGRQNFATGQAVGNNLQNAGQARATGYINQSNAFTGGLQGAADMYLMNRAQNIWASQGGTQQQSLAQKPTQFFGMTASP